MKRLKHPALLLGAALLMAVMLTAIFVGPALAGTHSGVDFAWHGPLNPEAFKKQGVEFVVRYLAGGKGGGKELTKTEADMWSKAGVGVVLVWETYASRATRGYDAGYYDASIAFPQAESLGMPDGKPVYFAVDVDTSGASVDAYFRGVYDWLRKNSSDGQATSRIGIYGGYDPVKHIMRAGYAKYGWQTRAWMYGRGWLPNVMQQHAFGVYIDGVETDVNRVPLDEYGQWTSTRVHSGTEQVDKSARDAAADQKAADESEEKATTTTENKATETTDATATATAPEAETADGKVIEGKVDNKVADEAAEAKTTGTAEADATATATDEKAGDQAAAEKTASSTGIETITSDGRTASGKMIVTHWAGPKK